MSVGWWIWCIDRDRNRSKSTDGSRIDLHGFSWSPGACIDGSLDSRFGRKRAVRIKVRYYTIELEGIEMAIRADTSELL